MREWIRNLSDSLVDRLVPRAEAAAAVECWTEEICNSTMVPMCHRTGFKAIYTDLVCSDGTRVYQGKRCAVC
ncbi:hypothetical protein ACH4KN_31415 [Streptomyces sp. NPDC017546]|uniref:hypothetical protein n=1 Tax=unclassified Streptomyces TaxID=2593676 RepID=UPI0023619BCF|nr:hypothetical protein [Streptomyces sp. MMBL 11-1]